jgi:type IV fimbrial biogenesis protein FimT
VLTGLSPQRGFNLIEVMVVVAVLAIIIGLAVPNFAEWTQNQRIRVAADAMQNGFQIARAEAVRRNLPVQLVVGPGSGWTVAEAVSGTAVQARSQEEGTIGVNVTPTPPGASVTTFSPIGGVMPNIDGTPTLQDVDIDNPAGGTCQTAGGPMRCLTVRVTGGGSIRLCDRKVSAPDPRAC